MYTLGFYIYKTKIYVIYVICNILHINIYEDIFISCFVLSNISTANVCAKADVLFIQILFSKTMF